MKRLALILLLLGCGASAAPRFVALDIIIDANQPVAAWQFELSAAAGTMTIVGVESGDSDAFRNAPYYDRDAVAGGDAERIIVADYSTADTGLLPSGRIRVATIHVMLDGDTSQYELKLVNVTTRNGERIDASISVREQAGSRR